MKKVTVSEKYFNKLEKAFNLFRQELKKENEELKKREICLMETKDLYPNFKEISEQAEYEKIIIWAIDSPLITRYVYWG